MHKTRLLARLAAKMMVFAVVTTGGLLIGRVANAAPPTNAPAESAVLDAHSTTTNLIVVPQSFPAGFPVTLVAIVRPPAATGTVQFKDGNSNIGDPVTVLPGHVTLAGQDNADVGFASATTSALAVGTHSLTAVFTPTDMSTYIPSTSRPESLTVTPSIFSELLLPIQSIPQSVLGGLGSTSAGPGSPSQFLSPIFGGAPTSERALLDSAQLIQSVLGGLHW